MRLSLVPVGLAVLLVVSSLASAGSPVIALLDSGVDPEAPYREEADVVAWVDIAGDESGTRLSAPYDDLGHGSAVASTIANVSPEVDLAVARIIGSDGRTTTGDLAEGIRWAVDVAEADVLVLPVQYPVPQPEDDRRIDATLDYAREKGSLPLWAAGNGLGQAPLPPSDTVPGSSSDDALTVGAAHADGSVWEEGNLNPQLLTWGVEIPAWSSGAGYVPRTGSSFAVGRLGGTVDQMLRASSATAPEPCQVEEAVFSSARDRLAVPPHREGHGFFGPEHVEDAVDALKADPACSPPWRDARSVDVTRWGTSRGEDPRRPAPVDGSSGAVAGHPANRFQSLGGAAREGGVDSAARAVNTSWWAHRFEARASGITGSEDVDVAFYGPGDTLIRSFRTDGAERGRIPWGSATVELLLRSGADARFSFTVEGP